MAMILLSSSGLSLDILQHQDERAVLVSVPVCYVCRSVQQGAPLLGLLSCQLSLHRQI